MTLCTTVYLADGTQAEAQLLFLAMRDIANIPPEWPFDTEGDGVYHRIGCRQALAYVAMRYGQSARGWWDTPYGFRGPDGCNCDMLHTRFVRELADRFPAWEDRLTFEDEYSGVRYPIRSPHVIGTVP